MPVERYPQTCLRPLLARLVAMLAMVVVLFAFPCKAAPAPDSTPPTIELADIPANTTVEDAVLVQGVARDDASGIADVEVTSDILGITISAPVDPGGGFTLEVPLEVGANAISIVARDHADLLSDPVEFTISRELTEVPQVVIDGPSHGFETTSAEVSVHGRVLTALDEDAISIRLGELRAIPTATTNGFAFSFDDLELSDGVNVIDVSVFSPHGSAQESVSIRRVVPGGPGDDGEPVGPSIEVAAGSDIIVVSGPSYALSGIVRSDDCVSSVVVDGLQPDEMLTTAAGVVSFSSAIPLPEDASYPVLIVAEGCNGIQSELEVLLVHDESAPVITLTAPTTSGATIEINQNPIEVTGTIDEAHLAGAMIGRIHPGGGFEGQPLVLEPEATDGQWRFTARVHLDRAQDTTIAVSAWDRAGFQSQVSFTARLEHDVSLALLSPKDGDQVGLDAGESSTPITVRVLDAGMTDSVVAQLDGGETILLGHGSGNHDGELTGLVAGQEHTAAVWVEDGSGDVLIRTEARFSAVDLDSLPVELVHQTPASGSGEVESNQALTVAFNRPVEPERVTVTVHESVHGFVYDSVQVDADILNQSKVERVRIDRSDEPVPGRTHNLPGDRAYEFFPHGEWTYGAEIEVDILIDGVSIGRTQFTVRGLPTLAHAFVVDQNDDPLASIDVELPDLGHTVTTDTNGLFSLGWGWTADSPLPPGVHKIIINPSAKNPGFGVVEGWITVQAEEVNGGPSFVLPRIRAPRFSTVEGGSRQVIENGLLVLGLEEAQLTFANGEPSGVVAPQMMDFDKAGYPSVGATVPLFAIRLEPGAVDVSGPTTFEIGMPQRAGSYAYLDTLPREEEQHPLAFLLALNPDSLTLRPVNVVEIDIAARRAVTPQANAYTTRLDVLALALVPPEALPAASQYLQDGSDFIAVVNAIATQ